MTEAAETDFECAFCCHGYDSHDVEAADGQRNMPCRDCPDGTCWHPGSAGADAEPVTYCAECGQATDGRCVFCHRRVCLDCSEGSKHLCPGLDG